LNTEEIPLILWNPEVVSSVHKSPQVVSTLSPTLPVHTILSYVLKQKRKKGDSKEREANREKKKNGYRKQFFLETTKIIFCFLVGEYFV
jgi:hypothetical protein